jgi:YebC/PmpR family DNA-binding regulatory protein
MSGHSHWANIAIKKGAADKKRGKLFGKLSRLIIVAARSGGGDPTMNLALRYAIDKAKKNSMPKENIERAVKRGCGETAGEVFEEVLYEGYGPNGVAILCEILTDNRNRTAGEVRKTFEVCGGNLGATGCVAWMFERKGLFTILTSAIDEEQLFETALEAGADDVAQEGEFFEVTCSPDVFQTVTEALGKAKVPTESADVTQIATQTVDLNATAAKRVLRLMDELEDNDDVQNVTANFSISDEVMAELTADL